MAELLTQFIAHLRGMWRFRWMALVVAWLVALVGWVWVYMLPNQFESETRVIVDTDSALRPLIRGLAPENSVMNQVTLMTRSLLSRPHLEKVARDTDLDLRATTPKEMDKLVDHLRRAIDIEGASSDNLYTITFRDSDPAMAQSVVQTLLSNFVGDTLKGNRSDSSNAMRFLEEQIREYDTRLVEAEQRLANFKKRNVGLMPGESGDYYQRLDSALSTLEQLRSEHSLKIRSRNELLKQIEGEEPVFGLEPGPSVDAATSYDVQIADHKARLADLNLLFTEKHPDIIALRETVATLESQRDAELAMNRSPGGAAAFNPLDMNPVYQDMKMSLSRTQIEIVELESRIGQQRRNVAELRRSVDTVPEVEAQLSRLNRDYEVTKTRYEALLQRLESARLGEDANLNSDDIKFKIIDPPTSPLEPVGPNRLLFITVTLLAALAAGLAFSFLMNQVRPVFISRKDLRSKTGLPVLGTIGVVLMPRQRLMVRMQTAAFALALLSLGLAYAGAVVFEEPFVEIARQAQSRGLL